MLASPPSDMRILGFSGLDRSERFKRELFPGLSDRERRIAQGFDAAAALVVDGRVVGAAAQERFSRKKATNAFPLDAIRWCLAEGGLAIGDVDRIAHGFSYGPVEEHFRHDEKSSARFDQVYGPDAQLEVLREHLGDGRWEERFVPVPHHLAHAASAFYPSGFEEALVLVTDGMGEIESLTAYVAGPEGLREIRKIPALHSLGVLYGVFTLYLGFVMGLDEYKVMGLAPYGDPTRYYDTIMDFVRLKPDGTYTIPLLAENTTFLEKETHRGALSRLVERLGPPRSPESEMTPRHMDLAASLQAALQTCQLHLLDHLQQETGLDDLCMAGGVALNCSANGVVRRSALFDRVFIQPAAGDDGAALGAALYVDRQESGARPVEPMGLPLWGPSFDDEAMRSVVKPTTDHLVTHFDDFEGLVDEAARLIADGRIIAWFQGGMEYGPRALGNRSILADPRAPDMRDRINALVKKREGFRPFAPAVLAEEAARIFEVDPGDEETFAHMLFVTMVKPDFREQLPAITHVDGSARVQTVRREANPRFWTLIERVGRLTGLPVVLNTSFNVRGQPIVCTPQEALDTFEDAGLDALVMGDMLIQSSREATPAVSGRAGDGHDA